MQALDRRWLSLALAGHCLFQLACALPAWADEAATISAVEQTVHHRLVSATAWNPAAVGQPVAVGDAIRTGPMSKAEFTYGDGTIVRLASSSTLVVMEHEHRVLRLLLGKIWARVTKHGRGMTVHTPAAIASITGTEFVLEVLPDQSTHLTVLEGTVLMFPLRNLPGSPAGGQPTRAGQGESVTVGGKGNAESHTTTGPAAGPSAGPQPADTGQGGKPQRQELDMDVGFGQSGGTKSTQSQAPVPVSAGQGLVARPEAVLPPAFQVDQEIVRVQEAQIVAPRLAPLTSAPSAATKPTTSTDITTQLQNQHIDPKDLKGSPTTGTLQIFIK